MGKRGRQSIFAGTKIFKLVKDNSVRPGTHRATSWKAIKKGIKYETYLKAGGRRVDLATEIRLGNAEVK